MRTSYFHIEWLSKTDGPGDRTVVFLQGCNLRCPWCHSPHSREAEAPIFFNPARCLNCLNCVDVCKNQVHFYSDNKHLLQRDNCNKCGKCIEVCPTSRKDSNSGALFLPTRYIDSIELFELIRPQLEVLKGCGGLTLSGGEALLQKEAVLDLLKLCRKHNIHTAIETSLVLPLEYYKSVSEYVDCWLVGMRDAYYENNTGKKDRALADTVSFLSGLGKEVIVRFPVIKGYTQSENVLGLIVSLMNSSGFRNIELLPCNQNMEHYYMLSGIKPEINSEEAVPDDTELANVAEYFKNMGLNVSIQNNL